MARLGRGGFLAIAILFHLVYIYSIFDIYFVSPIVHGMTAYSVPTKAPAQRLVLYVGDGLRADKAFQSFPDPSPANPNNTDLTPRHLAPFLRSKVLNEGTFGVSHTRVPTESRPGHVALIAGLYEDVSAVMTGWKINPVEFDSVFNRSRHTWSWGSPDICPMFSLGAVPGRVDADVYDAEFEDFTQDAVHLDYWVFDKVKALFAEAQTNTTLNAILRQDKLVFFLHLLGLDTTGHAYRPYSIEYLHNLKIVDQGVAEITQLIDDFYADDQTVYVFTADHGMSDWGSHGDGNPDSTRTPFIVWGSGVAKPVISKNGKAPGHEDGFSSDWDLDHVTRNDIEQADIAPLMSYLAGLEFPVNSVGKLPLPYVAGDDLEKAQAMFVNAQEVIEMYKVKEGQKSAASLRFKPYPPFVAENQSPDEQLSRIEESISQGQFQESIKFSQDLLDHALEGLRYLQTYDWLFLRALITIGYLGYIAYAFTTVIDLHVLHEDSSSDRSSASLFAFSSILVLLYASFIVERSPVTYYAYALFPVFFWEEVFARRKAIIAGLSLLLSHVQNFADYVQLGLSIVLYIGVLEAFVQSYFHRWIFTVCYILGAFWPGLYGTDFVRANAGLVVSWSAGCVILSTFTLLPVIKIESASTITAGGALMFLSGVVYILLEEAITSSSRSSKRFTTNATSRVIMGAQIGVILVTILVTRSSVASIQAKQGLPLGNQVTGWLCLVSSLVLPFVHRIAPNNHYLHRLVVLFLAFSPFFIILTISYEGLFYFFFGITLLNWVRLEHAIHLHLTKAAKDPSQKPLNGTATSSPGTTITTTDPTSDLSSRATFRTLTLPDLRTSLFFLFLLQSAFFSTGNIASVATFSLDAVYRLIPVFDPFSQGALLLFKIIIPFALISAALGILNRRLGLQSSALFMVVMAVSDVMTLNFFWMVRDEGSWLDIGTTISHFVIGSLLCVFVAGLEGVSEVLIQGVDAGVEGFEERVIQENGVKEVKTVENGSSKGRSRAPVVSGKQEEQERLIID